MYAVLVFGLPCLVSFKNKKNFGWTVSNASHYEMWKVKYSWVWREAPIKKISKWVKSLNTCILMINFMGEEKKSLTVLRRLNVINTQSSVWEGCIIVTCCWCRKNKTCCNASFKRLPSVIYLLRFTDTVQESRRFAFVNGPGNVYMYIVNMSSLHIFRNAIAYISVGTQLCMTIKRFLVEIMMFWVTYNVSAW